MNVCRTVLLRRMLALPTPARASRPLFASSTSSVSSSSLHAFSTSTVSRNAAAAAPADPPSQDAAASPDADAAVATRRSSCPEGTVLLGLNYTKGKTDPVALRDEDYPEWLWNCLDVKKKADTQEDADAGDEFSKSKKQRRMALKRQRELEAKVLATGDLTALAPKIPLQQQSLNLADSSADADTLAAAAKRKELRVALRKERRAKIKESNYLRSM
ncbi:hypothetical protein SEUCBS139899_000116 [Sporothrix eucalyptigena]|uniref:Large ribosomal subunit protein mL54 n=1 Tax=Sporothrix eucalyptigena TaxID=1812306 RepID=A0ABP0C0D8_9PEZI